MKKILSVLLSLMLVFSLVACGSSKNDSDTPKETSAKVEEKESAETPAEAPAETAEETAEKSSDDAKDTPKIAFVPKVMGQAWWDYVQQGVEEWSADNGIDIIYKGPTEVDAAAQVQIMTDIVNQGVDILCFSPNDPAACEAICKEAREKGIIVIATEASGMENIDYDVEAFDETGLGGFLMDQLAAQMNEEGEYITMVGGMTMESQNNWADAAVARQKEAYPNMTLVADERVENGSDSEKAYEITKELRQKYPELKGILGTGSFDAPGAARAIQEMGLTGEMFAISVAMPSEVKDYLEEGVLGSVALWDPAVTAKVMLNLSMKMYNGEDVVEGMDLVEVGYDSVQIADKVVFGQGQIAITTENVDDFGF